MTSMAARGSMLRASTFVSHNLFHSGTPASQRSGRTTTNVVYSQARKGLTELLNLSNK